MQMNPNEKKDDGAWKYMMAMVVIVLTGLVVTALKILGAF